MAMAGDISAGGTGRELVLHERKNGFPWSGLLTQLQNHINELHIHLNKHVHPRLQVGMFILKDAVEKKRKLAGRWMGKAGKASKWDHSIAGWEIRSHYSGRFSGRGEELSLEEFAELLVVKLNLQQGTMLSTSIASLKECQSPSRGSTICDPYLNIFRGIIPPLGTLDLSPILAFLALNVFTNAAAALPAELPSNNTIAQSPSNSHLTWRQRAQLKKGHLRAKSEENSNE